MPTRLPSLSVNETYSPTPGMSIGSPSTVPPAFATFLVACLISSTAITTDGCSPKTVGEVDPRMRPSPLGLFARGGRLRQGILRGDLPSGAGRYDGQALG